MKMQSRLEEEEEAKVALTSRIQRLTKLILVSSKNSIPGSLSDIPSQQRNLSFGDDDVSSLPEFGCVILKSLTNDMIDIKISLKISWHVITGGDISE